MHLPWVCRSDLFSILKLFAVEMNMLKFFWTLWLTCGGVTTASNRLVIVGHNVVGHFAGHLTTSLWFYCRWLDRGPPLCFHEVAEFYPPAHLGGTSCWEPWKGGIETSHQNALSSFINTFNIIMNSWSYEIVLLENILSDPPTQGAH